MTEIITAAEIAEIVWLESDPDIVKTHEVNHPETITLESSNSRITVSDEYDEDLAIWGYRWQTAEWDGVEWIVTDDDATQDADEAERIVRAWAESIRA